MTQAQIISLKEQVDSGKLKSLRAKTLNYVKNCNFGVTFRAVARAMNIKEHSADARLSELTTMGLIYVKGRNSLNNSMYFYEKDEEKQKERAKKIQEDKFLRWKKTGEKQGFFKLLEND